MLRRIISLLHCVAVVVCAWPLSSLAQEPPYDVFPAAEAPYYRVRYEGSEQAGELRFPVNYTVWIPP